MAETMGPQYELLQDFFLYPILRLCERTNKVISDRARGTLLAIFRSCPFPLRVVTSKLVECHSSPNKQLRHAVMEGLGVVVEGLSADVLAEQLDAIVRIVKAGLQDAADTVRSQSRTIFGPFAAKFPNESSQYLSWLVTI